MRRAWLAIATVTVFLGTMTSASWALPNSVVKQFSDRLSAKICEDGGAWLTCYRLDPTRCNAVIGELVAPCTAQSLAQVTGTMEYNEALAKARQIDGCVNEKFLAAYGFQKERSPECAQPPPHLRGES